MNARILSRIFLGTLVLLTVGIGYGFMQLTTMLNAKATEADHVQIDADTAEFEISRLRDLGGKLEKQRDIIDRAKEIVATGKEYQYQNQIVADVTAYAQQNGLSISSFTFTTDSAAKPAPATPTPGGAAQPPSNTSQKSTATINLRSPADYTNMLRFITQLENNLTQIQISTLALTPDIKNPNMLLNPSITIEVYIKQ